MRSLSRSARAFASSGGATLNAIIGTGARSPRFSLTSGEKRSRRSVSAMHSASAARSCVIARRWDLTERAGAAVAGIAFTSVPPENRLDISPFRASPALMDPVVGCLDHFKVGDIGDHRCDRRGHCLQHSSSASTSSSFARPSFFGSRPVAYFPTRRPRPAHSANAIQSRTVHRLKALLPDERAPEAFARRIRPKMRGVVDGSLPRGNSALSLQGTPGKRAKRVTRRRVVDNGAASRARWTTRRRA